MSKKNNAKKNGIKKAHLSDPAIGVMATAEPELSYDDMLSELEAIVSEADMRLVEEETSL
ncbi:hypothetical protein MUA01_07055 [Enterobacteriaceae bacterium H18W14]|uniref:hypothetical protein n=1 Tax=Dryocola boscaweniae TaxID=2925397 RepID=UPI0022F0F84C|nr:hypothetical protein [Dryocola boscaweniae]MCT4714733.1 hypothetical protein [Dryocola boscaweniae]